MSRWLTILGLGEDGIEALPAASRALIESAELLIGGARHLAMVAESGAERLTWRRPLLDTVADIEARRGQRVVVLATGDPLCYGVGVTLARHFAMDEMAVIPAPSAFSLACARLGWPAAEAEGLTLHGRPLEIVRAYLAPGQKLLILANDGATPRAVAELLGAAGYGASPVVVFEHMGGARERRIEACARDWREDRTADFNTIAVDCTGDARAKRFFGVPGLPDHAFENDGQMTKHEVRALTLSALAPAPGALLWDVGAGCGSVAIEWMLCMRRAQAIAIEREAGRLATIARNAGALGVPGLQSVHGSAPDALASLPGPDAVFIGGGLSTANLVEVCWEALKPGGRLVANAVTLEGEAALLGWRERLGGALSRIAIARARPIGAFSGWRPLRPVTQLSARKP